MAGNNTQETTDIAVNGDVVFVVGPSCRKLRVNSLFVKSASPVFTSLLGPNFEEGHRLAENGSAEIPLPEDDASTMETIFNVIHGRNDLVEFELSPDALLQVAITINKYDCSSSLAFATRTWLGCMKFTNSVDSWNVALAATILGRKESFAEATSWLAFNYAGSFFDLASKNEALIDDTVLLKIASMFLRPLCCDGRV